MPYVALIYQYRIYNITKWKKNTLNVPENYIKYKINLLLNFLILAKIWDFIIEWFIYENGCVSFSILSIWDVIVV
jgi:Cu2+-containing amine oxidase